MLGIRSNQTTRYIIGLFSFFCLTSGTIASFGSIMRLGQQTQTQAAIDSARELQKQNHIADVQTEAEKAKAAQKFGIGVKTDQFIIRGISDKNFFTATEKFADAIKSFKSENPMNILDQHRNIVGTFDGVSVCNLQRLCKQLP